MSKRSKKQCGSPNTPQISSPKILESKPQQPPSPPSLQQPSSLAHLFECPVCYDYILPPITQCHSGHLICSNCRPKLPFCPTCRGNLQNIRNLAMERVAKTIKFPCKHSENGCKATLNYVEKPQHEETCKYRPHGCPCPEVSCPWQGTLEQVIPHLTESHKKITNFNGKNIVFLAPDINLPGPAAWALVQTCFDHHFLFVLVKQEGCNGHARFFAIVQLIGTREQAENFEYRLRLNGERRHLTWEAMPRASNEGVASAIGNCDCLVFDMAVAKLFAGNGELRINVTITEVE